PDGDAEGADELKQPEHQGDVDVSDDLRVHEGRGPVRCEDVQEVPGHEGDGQGDDETQVRTLELGEVVRGVDALILLVRRGTDLLDHCGHLSRWQDDGTVPSFRPYEELRAI